jgi:cobalt transporter subunit CbtA
MFTRLLTSAVFAGAAAGLVAAVLQLLFVQPVLLHAELYETGTLVHFGAASDVAAVQNVGDLNLVRDGLSIVFTMLIYSGYALILLALMAQAEARSAIITARTGMVWGLAGYVAVQLAPAFSLAPEVPGVAAADVELRQIWWFGTVIASAIAMGLIAFGRNWAAWGAACILLLAPHLIGAPEPDVFAGTVPPELSALFASRALGVGFAAWVALGGLCGHFWKQSAST